MKLLSSNKSFHKLGFSADPLSNPLTYPGVLPNTSGVMVGDFFIDLEPAGSNIGEWKAFPEEDDPISLDQLLGNLGVLDVKSRFAVVAIGSNASPAQMFAKFSKADVSTVIPMVQTMVSGVRAGLSAHVSRPGYVPATPVADKTSTSSLFCLWLDPEQIEALDRTEPNYHRVPLSTVKFPALLPNGHTLTNPYCYISKHGCITDASGNPIPLGPQNSVIPALIADIPNLRELAGENADEWLLRMSDPDVRDQVRELLRASGRVLDQGAVFS